MDAFKHVGKAYATLSDERKRRNYDQFGESAQGGLGDINLDEIFRQAFGNQDIGQIFAQAFGAGLRGQRGGSPFDAMM